MSEYVTDTHAILWHLAQDSRLGSTARRVFEQADIGQATIVIPSIVLVECVYLIEKHRVDEGIFVEILARIAQQQYPYRLAQTTMDIIGVLRQIDRNVLPDMPDRIIAATALQLRVPLLTKDGRMPGISELNIIW